MSRVDSSTGRHQAKFVLARKETDRWQWGEQRKGAPRKQGPGGVLGAEAGAVAVSEAGAVRVSWGEVVAVLKISALGGKTPRPTPQSGQ